MKKVLSILVLALVAVIVCPFAKTSSNVYFVLEPTDFPSTTTSFTA